MNVRALFSTLLFFVAFSQAIFPQVVTYGPEIKNEKNKMLTRIIDGNDSCFFTYRLKTRGESSYFMVERYNKASLVRDFTLDVDLGNNLESILAVEDKLYIFFHRFDDEAKKMLLLFQVVSPDGKLSPEKVEIMAIETNSSNFVDFDIIQNENRTKFVCKASYKYNKNDEYRTDFIFVDAYSFKRLDRRAIGQAFFTTSFPIDNFFGKFYKGVEFLDMFIDSAETIYCGFIQPGIKGGQAKMNMIIVPSGLKKPHVVEVDLIANADLKAKCVINSNNELIVGGFFKRIDKRQGRDDVFNGVFGCTIDLSNLNVTARYFDDFDGTVLKALGTKLKHAENTEYTFDYIFTKGKDVFLVGEQYKLKKIVHAGMGTENVRITFNQDYMDVVIAKYDPIGKFEWIRNTPFRFSMTNVGMSEFTQYFACSDSNKIYIFNNESSFNSRVFMSKGYKPSKLVSHSSNRGSNFVYSSVTFTDGLIDHKVVFNNENYCFVPNSGWAGSLNMGQIFIHSTVDRNRVKVEREEVFLKQKKQIYLFTHQKEKDRFARIVLD